MSLEGNKSAFRDSDFIVLCLCKNVNTDNQCISLPKLKTRLDVCEVARRRNAADSKISAVSSFLGIMPKCCNFAVQKACHLSCKLISV